MLNINIAKSSVRNKGDKIAVKLEFTIDVAEQDKEYWSAGEFKSKLERNKKWMLEHLMTWVNWDWSPTIDLLAAALENLGRGIRDNGSHKTAIRDGRRAMAIAQMLKKIYYTDPVLEDQSYINLNARKHVSWVPYKKGLTQMKTKYLYDNAMNMDREVYDDKMFKIIYKRCQEVNRQRKQEVWAHLGKYIEKFWD